MGRRRRPRTFSEDPWVVLPCCGLPMILLYVVTIGLLTYWFGGGLVDWVIACLVVFGGIVGLLYAVNKRYNPHSAPFCGFLSIFFSTRALWMIYLQKSVFDYHECSV
jgi:hypothetical protein